MENAITVDPNLWVLYITGSNLRTLQSAIFHACMLQFVNCYNILVIQTTCKWSATFFWYVWIVKWKNKKIMHIIIIIIVIILTEMGAKQVLQSNRENFERILNIELLLYYSSTEEQLCPQRKPNINTIVVNYALSYIDLLQVDHFCVATACCATRYEVARSTSSERGSRERVLRLVSLAELETLVCKYD